MANVKLTVTIPSEMYEKIETGKKRKKINRSLFVQEAIHAYFAVEEEKEKTRKYIEGYKKYPEDKKDIKNLEKLQSKTLHGDF
jgi:metal-responsive CopG/Arc/MetJ family transcriptional regulator